MAFQLKKAHLRRAVMIFALIGPCYWGCADDEVVLHFVVSTDLEVPEEMSELRAWITASRTEQGTVCEPSSRMYFLESSEQSFPITISIFRGSVYDQWIAIRVSGYSNGTEVIRRESKSEIMESNTTRYDLFLGSDCYAHECDVNMQCHHGVCVEVPAPGVFDDEALRDVGVSCDRFASP